MTLGIPVVKLQGILLLGYLLSTTTGLDSAHHGVEANPDTASLRRRFKWGWTCTGCSWKALLKDCIHEKR